VTLIAAQVAVGLLGIEVGGGSARASATRHRICLDGAQGWGGTSVAWRCEMRKRLNVAG
jgi:hypothetical protein